MCYVINRAMRSAWWLVADCLRCTGTLHVRTPPISQLPTAPPHLLFLLSAGLRVAVAIPPFRRRLAMRTLWCPAATDLVVLLRSYLQPPHPLFLHSTRLRVAVGAATDPYYHSLVLPRHQSTLPSPPMPSYTMLPCSPQLPTPRLPPSVFPRSSFGSTADHGHYH